MVRMRFVTWDKCKISMWYMMRWLLLIVSSPMLLPVDVIACSTSRLRSQRITLVARGDPLGISQAVT